MTEEKTKILFLDDEKYVLNGIQRLIRNELKAWDVLFLTDSIQARDKILKEKFDVVVTDIRMPELDGLSLLREIKHVSGFNSPEFIIVTGLGDEDLKQKALNLDAADLMNKPIQKEELLARIRNAIRLKKSKDEVLEKNKLLEVVDYGFSETVIVSLYECRTKHCLRSSHARSSRTQRETAH